MSSGSPSQRSLQLGLTAQPSLFLAKSLITSLSVATGGVDSAQMGYCLYSSSVWQLLGFLNLLPVVGPSRSFFHL